MPGSLPQVTQQPLDGEIRGKQGSLKATEAWPALQVSQQSGPGQGRPRSGCWEHPRRCPRTQSSQGPPEAASGPCSAPPFLPPCEGLPSAPRAPPEAGGPAACPRAPRRSCVPKGESAQDALTRTGATKLLQTPPTAPARLSSYSGPRVPLQSCPPGLAVHMATSDRWPGC